MVGAFSTAVLALFPGTWVSFLLPLKGLSFLSRIFLGFTLTPLVLYAEFLLIRTMGVSFDSSAWILVLVNLPALALMTYRWSGLQDLPQTKTLGLSLIVYLLAMFLYAFHSGGEQNRIIGGGHLWLRADIIYSLASGDLPPEERQIAGLKLAYPWAFYVEQALISYWLNSTHLSIYIWTNASWLLAVSFFAIMTVQRFGSSPTTPALSLVFLYFGVNIVGFILNSIFPITLGPWESTIWGDGRYTPWILKFFNSTPMIPGLCSVFALLFALTENSGKKLDWAILLLFLLVSTGIIYPLLLPVGCAFIAARITVVLVDRFVFKEKICILESIILFVVVTRWDNFFRFFISIILSKIEPKGG